MVQILACVGTFSTIFSLQVPFILFGRLENPFDAHDDRNAENLVANNELTLHVLSCHVNLIKQRPQPILVAKLLESSKAQIVQLCQLHLYL